jgi:hypothetical protein
MIPVAERSKTRVCGQSLAGKAGSNPAVETDVCLLWMLCCQEDVSPTGWSLVQVSPADFGVSLCVIKKLPERGGLGQRWAVALEVCGGGMRGGDRADRLYITRLLLQCLPLARNISVSNMAYAFGVYNKFKGTDTLYLKHLTPIKARYISHSGFLRIECWGGYLDPTGNRGVEKTT